jgi:hypothetical protein
MSRYTCPLAEEIGHHYSLAPEQVWPGGLRSLGSSWHPQGRDLSEDLNAAAGRLEDELQRLGLPQDQAVGSDEDGREMARRAMSGHPALLAEVERGWARRDRRDPPGDPELKAGR